MNRVVIVHGPADTFLDTLLRGCGLAPVAALGLTVVWAAPPIDGCLQLAVAPDGEPPALTAVAIAEALTGPA